MYLNTMSDALKGKAVDSVQKFLLKMMRERREETIHIPLAREFLFLEIGQSVKLNPVVLNTPLIKLQNERGLPCMLTFWATSFLSLAGHFVLDSGLVCLKLLG